LTCQLLVSLSITAFDLYRENNSLQKLFEKTALNLQQDHFTVQIAVAELWTKVFESAQKDASDFQLV